jgi:hypothetical protein
MNEDLYRVGGRHKSAVCVYMHDGFNSTRTQKFAERLAVFQCPVVFSVPSLLNERIQACIASIEDPKVDVNAYYHGRTWYNPLPGEYKRSDPIAFFITAVVTAPPTVIEAMMNRQDTDDNITAPGPENDVEAIGAFSAHIAFRDKRDGRDPVRDGLHQDTVSAFRTLFSDP